MKLSDTDRTLVMRVLAPYLSVRSYVPDSSNTVRASRFLAALADASYVAEHSR